MEDTIMPEAVEVAEVAEVVEAPVDVVSSDPAPEVGPVTQDQVVEVPAEELPQTIGEIKNAEEPVEEPAVGSRESVQ